MIKLYIYCSVLIIGNVEVGPDIGLKFHQEVMEIVSYDTNIKTHLQHIEILFQRLREANLKLKESKCNFLKKHVQYLGHLISGEGIEPVPEKLKSIKHMPAPETPKEVKQFLGLIGYYRKFIPKFSDLCSKTINKFDKKGCAL